MKVSIIVPVAAGEEMWRRPFEWDIPADWQLIIAAAPNTKTPPITGNKARWLACPRQGRAAQMNAAAACADNEWLWFVHADTVLCADTCQKLRAAIGDYRQPDTAKTPILYFDLRFVDGGAKMRINEWGVRLRCALFGNPFGDQALCLTQAALRHIGGYDEDADYGEDHLLVLRARQKGIGVRRIPAAVGTSARRYLREGWWRTVLLYRRLWVRQYRKERRR
ncbi:MAG: hypothetical protein ACR2P4_10775 [Gammaproteobacteria bacterium]